MGTSRRRFLQSSALAAAAISAPVLNAAEKAATVKDRGVTPPTSLNEDPRMQYYDAYYFKEPNGFRFEQPFDGGILQEGTGYPILGTETGPDGIKRLKVHMVVKCSGVSGFQLLGPDGKSIQGDFIHGSFMTTVLVKDRITIFKARGTRNGKPVEISCRVIWAKNAYKRYRCYIDDHSFCFRDILQKEYKSIFDCFYFAKLRELNRMYKTKIVLNCFNSTPKRDFTLSMFPDKYKHEFEDNAEWLRLAFHAENEFPPEPYREAPPEKLAADFDLIANQLKRIAGKAYTAGLQIHFATVRADSYQVLVDRGVKMLSTGGTKHPYTGDKYCDFMLPNNITAYIRENAGWMDPKSGMIFYNGIMPSMCEWIPVSQMEQLQHKKLDNPKQNLLVNVAGHEQYWWPFYHNYIPNNFAQWSCAIRHVTEHGYKSIWIEDGFFGGCE